MSCRVPPLPGAGQLSACFWEVIHPTWRLRQVGGSLLVLHLLLGFKPPPPLQTFPPDREARGLGTPVRGWERIVRVLQARGSACTKTGGGERLRLSPQGSGML